MAAGGSDAFEVIKTICCCSCAEKNCRKEAEKYCLDCKEYYCQICEAKHQSVAETSAHKLLGKVDFKNLGLFDGLPCYPTQRCSEHTQEIVNMYCKDHDTVNCCSCINEKHRNCKTVISVTQDIDLLFGDVHFHKIPTKVKNLKTSMSNIIQKREAKLRLMKASAAELVKQVKLVRNELSEIIGRIEKNTIKHLENDIAKLEMSTEYEINEASAVRSSLDQFSVGIARSAGNKAQEFVSSKFFQNITDRADQIPKLQNSSDDEIPRFETDDRIKKFLMSIKTFGKMTLASEEEPSKYGQSKGMKDFYVKIEADTMTCSISGCCITETGEILLADSLNKRLKRMDPFTGMLVDYLNLEHGPFSVCTTGRTEAAVSLNNQSVILLSIEDKLKESRTLQMEHDCYGLVHTDKKLIITDSDFTKCVYIYNTNGTQLKRIFFESDISNNELFISPRHIAVSNNGDTVFIADFYKGLITLDISGNYITTTTDKRLSGYQGVCMIGKNVFVCGLTSCNVLKFPLDSEQACEFIKTTNMFPVSMSFDPVRNKLLVTQCNSNKILMIDLK